MTIISTISTAARQGISSLAILSAVLLAGCSMDGAELEDNYVQQTPEERFPIKVAEAPVKMNIDARSGSLRAQGLNRVIGFAQDARSNATSRISVHYASGNSHARKVAQDAVGVLVAQGIPRNMISAASYRGSSGMVTLAFKRKVAVTKECGDWSENLATSQYNESWPNNGCSMQQNMAAMVANPEDFDGPRPMTPVYGSTRATALKEYYGTGAAGDPGSIEGGDSGSGSSGGGASPAAAN